MRDADRFGEPARGLPSEYDSWEEAEEAQQEALRAAHKDAIQHEVYMNAEPGATGEELNARVEEKLEDEGWYDE